LKRNDAVGRGRADTVDLCGDCELGAQRLPRLRQTSFENPQAKTRVPEAMANRLDTRGQPRFAANGTWRQRHVRHAEPAAEGETSKRRAPQSSPELTAMQGHPERPNQGHPGEYRPFLRLPLRADEQPAQPRRCDPRKHQAPPSKARARHKPQGDGLSGRRVLAAVGERVAARQRAWPIRVVPCVVARSLALG
jgi:hypothetical protein